MSNEADTCRKYVLPKLVDAGWGNEPHRINEQVTFTDGWIILAGNKVRRRPQKPGLNLLSIRALNLPIPSLIEQSRIVAYLDNLQTNVDPLKCPQSKTAAELDAILTSILRKAFQGGFAYHGQFIGK